MLVPSGCTEWPYGVVPLLNYLLVVVVVACVAAAALVKGVLGLACSTGLEVDASLACSTGLPSASLAFFFLPGF